MRQTDAQKQAKGSHDSPHNHFFPPACLLQQDLRSVSALLLLSLPVLGVQLQTAPRPGGRGSCSHPARALPHQKRALLHRNMLLSCFKANLLFVVYFFFFLKGNQKGQRISTEVMLKLSLAGGFFLIQSFLSAFHRNIM